MTTAVLTDVEKIRRLPWLGAGDVFNSGFVVLTFGGPVFVLFLDEIGLENAQIGLLLSLIPFWGIVAPFIAPLVARHGYKRVYVTFWTIRKFVMALMLLTPAILIQFGPGSAFLWVGGIIFFFAMCRSVAETGGYPWKKEVVPDSMRGKFSAISNMSATLTGIIVATGASFVIDSGSGLSRYMTLIAIGLAFGFLSAYAYSRVPAESSTDYPSSRQIGHLPGMLEALRDRAFLFFLTALGLGTIGGTSIIAFIPLFMKEQVGLTEGNVVLLSIGVYLGAMASSYLWGWAADRYGSQPVMQTSLTMMLALPFAWFVMPRFSALSLPVAMAIALLAGASSLAWQISWMRYLFVNAIPSEKKSPYMAVYYAWFGIASGLGPLVAGQILDIFDRIDSSFLIFTVDAYTPLFALSALLLLVGLTAVAQLPRQDATTFRRFAGMFLRGNPIRAFNSLIQYSFAGDEMTRVITTERLGDAHSPLSIKELTEALSDPSSHVRYQAINSIGRLRPAPELVDALLPVLEGKEVELSIVAARVLGRFGDPRAILPLREALASSDFRLLRANSARSLAQLDDIDSMSTILERFRTEPNPTLRVAYASALGKLGATEAIDEILTLLRQTKSEVLRAELGLALARMAGTERFYMQHWRSLNANPSTATARALLSLQKLANQSNLDPCADLAGKCAQRFAEGDSDEGSVLLRELICHLPTDRLDQEVAAVLRACANGLAEFGDARLEFILLSLHTLDIALRQNGH